MESVNQVKHLYVVKAASDITPVGTLKDGLSFVVKDVDGNPMRTDILKNIDSVKAVTAEAMQRKLKRIKLTTTQDVLQVGENYVVTLVCDNFIGISPENRFSIFAEAIGKLDTASSPANPQVKVGQLYYDLAKSLTVNAKGYELVEVKCLIGTTEKSVSAVTDGEIANIVGIIIQELPQKFILGIKHDELVQFKVTASQTKKDSLDVTWATFTDVSADARQVKVGNGRRMADMEYFCMGERGDIYRYTGVPTIPPTKYMVDATQQYDVISFHYSYVGANHSVQKSEADLILVMPCGVVGSEDHTLAGDVVDAINTKVAGLVVKPTEWA